MAKKNNTCKCCVCNRDTNNAHIRTSYGTYVCLDCGLGIGNAMASFAERLGGELELIRNNYGHDEEIEEEEECDEDFSEDGWIDEDYPEPTPEELAYLEFSEKHPRLLQLMDGEIRPEDVVVRLDWFIEGQEEQKQKAAEIFCKLYKQVLDSGVYDYISEIQRVVDTSEELAACGKEIVDVLGNEVWI